MERANSNMKGPQMGISEEFNTFRNRESSRILFQKGKPQAAAKVCQVSVDKPSTVVLFVA